jgi:inward rectifier potassium channel
VLEISWARFLSHILFWYIGVNLIFAAVYLACGPGALEGPEEFGLGMGAHIARAFFFSIQTLATIGYGRIAPIGFAANVVVAVESIVGLVLFGLIAGVGFARFSRPRPSVRFSEKAVMGPYQGFSAFMFRLVNARDAELYEVAAEVAVARLDLRSPGNRLFDNLTLERQSISLFPLSWTIVHPIDESSPLWGVTEEEMRLSEAEFLVRLTAFEETSGQTVHIRTSYKWDEIVWGAKFVNIIDRNQPDGIIKVDVQRVNDVEKVALPAAALTQPSRSVPAAGER